MRRWALWQWALVAIFALFVAAEALVYAQPAPPNCGLNMLCRVKTLVVTGISTFSGGVTVSGTISAQTLDGGSIRGTTGNFSGPVVVSNTISAQTLDGGSIRGTTLNLSGALTGTTETLTGDITSSGTASLGVVDAGPIIGTTLNLSSAIKAATLTLSSKAPTGAWAVHWDGVVAEGVNGEGGYYSDNIPPGFFEYVACSCRVAGTGGTNGIFVELFEGGVAAANVELSGGDANACDDAAGTQLTGLLHYGPTNGGYTLQFKNTTDCASNPTDCACNVMIER